MYGTVYVIKAFIVKQMIIKKTFATVQRLYIFYNNRTVKVPEVYVYFTFSRDNLTKQARGKDNEDDVENMILKKSERGDIINCDVQ